MKTTYFISWEFLEKYRKALIPIVNEKLIKEKIEKLNQKGKNLTLNIDETVKVVEKW